MPPKGPTYPRVG